MHFQSSSHIFTLWIEDGFRTLLITTDLLKTLYLKILMFSLSSCVLLPYSLVQIVFSLPSVSPPSSTCNYINRQELYSPSVYFLSLFWKSLKSFLIQQFFHISCCSSSGSDNFYILTAILNILPVQDHRLSKTEDKLLLYFGAISRLF